MKHTLTLFPDEKTIEVDEDKSLLEVLKAQGLYIKSSCGGHASCSDCIIKIRAGEDNLEAPNFQEIRLLGNVFHITKERLACQTRIKGPVSIDISNHSKAKDDQRIVEKNAAKVQKKILLKKSGDIERERAQRMQERKEKPPKQSGFKRPKAFKTDFDDS